MPQPIRRNIHEHSAGRRCNACKIRVRIQVEAATASSLAGQTLFLEATFPNPDAAYPKNPNHLSLFGSFGVKAPILYLQIVQLN